MNELLTNDDELFNCSFEDKFLIDSFFGWEFSDEHRLYNYFMGYKIAANDLYKQYVIYAKEKAFEKTDTMIFPLIFLYRHSLELYIKFLFFKYSYTDEKEKKIF